MSPEDVSGESRWIELGPGVAIRGAGLTAILLPPRAATQGRRRRAGADPAVPEPLEAAMRDVDMREQQEIELVLDANAPAVRRRRGGEVGAAQVAEVAVDPPPAGHEQVILAVSEEGVLTWHLAEDEVAAERRRRAGGHPGGARRIYRVPLHAWDETGDAHRRGGRRGLFSAIGRKLLKVIVFPVTDLVLGPLEKFIALKWEDRKAPYVVRTFTPDDYRTEVRTPLSADQWRTMGTGRALLFVHGTFSSAQGAFTRFTPEEIRAFHDRYQGRVFAFNHHSVGHDPKQNVQCFCASLPADGKLELDIVCHSRGGLVSRVLSVAADELGGNGRVDVRRIVFVGTPNEGTLLADRANMTKMIDRYTNLAQFLPDGPLEIAVELVLTAVKALAHAGLRFLPGLAAQAPDSDFLQWLRCKPTRATHYALAADFEPAGTTWQSLVLQTVRDQVMDEIFQKAENDLVVPTSGVGEPDRSIGFPTLPENRHVFPATAGLTHSDFFGNAEAKSKIMEWLA